MVTIMGKINNVGQKIKGNLQQLKGKIEIATGQHVRGKISEIRGKANVVAADIKAKTEGSLK